MSTIRFPPLHPPQREIGKATELYRFVIATAGRRFGKNIVALVVAAMRALHGARILWLASTFQGGQVMWRDAHRMFGPLGAAVTFRAADMVIEFAGGGAIVLRSAEQRDSLRGAGYSYAVLDECAFIDESIWPSIVRPMLADKQGGALFISSPNGMNWFHDLWLRGTREPLTDTKSFQFATLDNPHINPAEVEAARDGGVSPIVFAQEWLGRFVSAAGARVQRSWLKIEQPPRTRVAIVQGWDLAISEKSSADWSACVTLGRTPEGVVWVLGAHRLRAPFHGVCEAVKEQAAVWEPMAIAVEQVSAFAGVVTELQRTTDLPIHGVRPKGSKLERFAASVEGRIENGIIRFARDLPQWFFDELCAFGASTTGHDDSVDALVHSYSMLRLVGNGDGHAIGNVCVPTDTTHPLSGWASGGGGDDGDPQALANSWHHLQGMGHSVPTSRSTLHPRFRNGGF